MKEYKVSVKGLELTVFQDEDGRFIVPQEVKELEKFGTTLKPSYEPIIVARKPCDGTVTENVLKWGVGGINIDECRVGDEVIGGGTTPNLRSIGKLQKETIGVDKLSFGQVRNAERIPYAEHIGRFPANTILTYDDTDFDEVCGGFPVGGKNGSISKPYKINNQVFGDYGYCKEWEAYDDSGSAARYFYCAKASKRDRDEGCNMLPNSAPIMSNQAKADNNTENDVNSISRVYVGKNTHPTVKPTSLMQYLVRLVTPKGGTVLDPFMGSGSTGKATMYENKDRHANYSFVGVELTEEYLPICKARIDYAICSSVDGVAELKEEDSTNKEEVKKPYLCKASLLDDIM